jgi:hypothetical protein
VIDLEPVLGVFTGFALGAAVGLVPAFRKFALGFLAAVILIQLYLDGAVRTYQASVSEAFNDVFPTNALQFARS